MKAEADEAGAGHPLLGQAGSQDLELLMPQRAFFAVQASLHYFKDCQLEWEQQSHLPGPQGVP